VILTDNGSEFKRPDELERSPMGRTRCRVFYCDSRASQQKGRCEKNHEYIRRFFPQGSSFNGLTQDDVNLMMSHINSVKRDSLNGASPFDVLSKTQLNDMKKLGLTPISPDRVVLSPSLFKNK
jgi:IS30 family transposase